MFRCAGFCAFSFCSYIAHTPATRDGVLQGRQSAGRSMAQPLHNEDKLTVHSDPNTLIVVKRARRSTRSGLHQHDGVALRSIRPAREQPSAQRCRGRTGTRSSRPHHFSTFRHHHCHHCHHHHLSWPSAFSLPLPLWLFAARRQAPHLWQPVACSRAQQAVISDK